ncbi:PA2169 family four-helix-bundle protein [Spirosoma arcticum]
MIKNEEIVDDLNDLVKINNDRIQGYEKAIEDNEDAQLDDLFRHYVVQSQKFRSQLAEHIVRIDGTAVTDATTTDISSKIHRAWIDIKSAVTGKDRDTVLSSVEFGESAAVEAYKSAIEKDHLPAYIKEDLTKQLGELNEAYEKMKALHKAA